MVVPVVLDVIVARTQLLVDLVVAEVLVIQVQILLVILHQHHPHKAILEELVEEPGEASGRSGLKKAKYLSAKNVNLSLEEHINMKVRAEGCVLTAT